MKQTLATAAVIGMLASIGWFFCVDAFVGVATIIAELDSSGRGMSANVLTELTYALVMKLVLLVCVTLATVAGAIRLRGANFTMLGRLLLAGSGLLVCLSVVPPLIGNLVSRAVIANIAEAAVAPKAEFVIESFQLGQWISSVGAVPLFLAFLLVLLTCMFGFQPAPMRTSKPKMVAIQLSSTVACGLLLISALILGWIFLSIGQLQSYSAGSPPVAPKDFLSEILGVYNKSLMLYFTTALLGVTQAVASFLTPWPEKKVAPVTS